MKKLLLLTMALCVGLAVTPAKADVWYEVWNAVPVRQAGDNQPLLVLNDWTNMPTPDGTGTLTNFGMGARAGTDVFTYRQTGYINAPATANYAFWTDSDDGSMVYIDGVRVAKYDGWHGMDGGDGRSGEEQTSSVYFNMNEGWHLIEVYMYEDGGGEGLEVRVESPEIGLSRTLIPNENLSLPVIPTTPTPYATGVELTGALEWTNPLSASEFKVYLSTDRVDNDPNAKSVLVTGASTTLEAVNDGPLESGAKYYLRIDTVAEPNDVRGAMFVFDAETNVPVITEQPQSLGLGSGGCTGVFTVAATSGTYDNYGELSYQWYDDNGAIDGETGDTLIAGAEGSYYCVVTNPSGDTASASARLTILGDESVLYDFEGGGPGFTVNGNAAVNSGSMRLTEDAGSLNGSVIFDPISTDPVGYFKVSFDFLARDADGADGMSFALMDAGVFDSTAIFGESGPGVGSLSIGIDLYDNGGEAEVGGNYFDIRLDNVVIASAVPSFTMEGTGWHHVDISFNSGLLTLAVTREGGTPETLFDAVPVTGYTPFAGRFGFGARTGGVSNEHRVDNVLFGGPDWKVLDPQLSPAPDVNGWLPGSDPVTINWDKSLSTPCSGVEYKVYASMDYDAVAEPNAAVPSGLEPVATTTDLTSGELNIGLDVNQEWFYRIDITDGSATQKGEVFSFLTFKTLPYIITPLPSKIVVPIGSTLTGAVDAGAEPEYPITSYVWKVVVGSIDAPDPAQNGDDIIVGTGNPIVVPDFQLSMEGQYYCVITNVAGSINSNVVAVQAARAIAHWTMDTIVDGKTPDATGNKDAVLYNGPVLVAGVTGEPGDMAVQFDRASQQYAVAGAVGISGKQARSISCWVRATSTTMDDWTEVFGFTSTPDGGDNLQFDFNRRGGRNTYCMHVWGWERDLTDVDMQWHLLVGTYDGTTIRWYSDGVLKGTDSSRALNTQDNVQMARRGHNTAYLAGVVDDAIVYNYVLSDVEVAEMYTSVMGGFICPGSIDPGDAYDLNNDCDVDLKDYAILAGEWMVTTAITPQP